MSENWTQLADTLGIEIVTTTADECVIEMPTRDVRQPYGVLHGGINGVVVEHAGSILARSNAPDGRIGVGTELSVSNLAPNTSELVRARATVLKAGRSSLTALVEVTDAAGNLTASGRLTCVFIAP
ncbi:PaaI family thioesterase [Trueperella sp.]|uniref:PaaI family thioesterase n=1 Tax=Trueperella sp. TaxID=2699835 RepID=UPI0037351168